MPPSTHEQAAGLSTAESDSSTSGSKHEAGSNNGQRGDSATSPNIAHSAAEPHHPSTVTSPLRKGFFSMASYKRAKSHDGISLSQSITNSAPTVLIHTPSTCPNDDPRHPPLRRPLRSAMLSRTIHESLHRGRNQNKNRPRDRSVSFAQVNIREYERILGDNPSVTSGPPLGIGWKYVPEPIVMNVDDYENGKGSPRSSSEYLVPKSVRENMLKEHAGVSRREMVNVVRAIQKEKSQRRKTVVNLSMSRAEEKVEGAKRKIKKILKPSTSYEHVEARLWDEAHAVAMDKAKKLEDSLHRGESVSMRNVYSVGTPYNNILPSRRNSTRALGGLEEGKKEESVDTTSKTEEGHDLSFESVSKRFTPKSTTCHQPHRSSAGDLNEPRDQNTSVNKEGEKSRGAYHRTSSNIVASESESEEIFAKLLLDDARF